MKKSVLQKVFLVLGIFLLTCNLPFAFADGMPPPIVVKNFDLTSLEERQQYAVVEVLNKNYEMIHLFLSLNYVDKNKHNITIIFPLVSAPEKVEGLKTTDKEFLKKYKYSEIMEVKRLQSLTESLRRGLSIYNDYYFTPSFKLPLPVYFFASSYSLGAASRGVEHVETYTFEGGKAEIYKVESGKTLEDFLRENYSQIELPEKLKEAIDKYKRHYVALLTLEVGGLDEEGRKNYEFLEASNPELLKEVLKYAKEKPEISVRCVIPHWCEYTKWRSRIGSRITCYFLCKKLYCRDNLKNDETLYTCYEKCDKDPYYILNNISLSSQLYQAYKEEIEELKSEYQTCSCTAQIKSQIERDFLNFIKTAPSEEEIKAAVNLIYSIYKNQRKGFQIDIHLPIKEEVYYPLGTGVAWYAPIKDTRILVKIPAALEAELHRDYVLYNGSRYYIWEFKDANPDFDITGKIRERSSFTEFKDSVKYKVQKLNENYVLPSLLTLVIFIFMVIFSSFIDAKYLLKDDTEIAIRKKMKRTIPFYLYLLIFSPILSVYVASLFGIIFRKNWKYNAKRVVLFIGVCILISLIRTVLG